MNPLETDKEYEVHKITKVKRLGDGWELAFDEGMPLSFSAPEGPIEPKVGMTAHLYLYQGSLVRGLIIDGHTFIYRTKEQQKERSRRQSEEYDRKKREDFEKNREDMDRRVAALPEVFRRRIERFRKYNAEFRWEFEPYELFCCEEAVKIAAVMKTGEQIRKFHDLPWEEQKKLVTIDDGHSGNTFGCSCRLAYHFVTKPGLVVAEHGALCTLVGCEEYGCFGREEALANA